MHIRPLEEKDSLQFYELVERNRERLITYFPKILQGFRDKETANEFVALKIHQAQKMESYFFVIALQEPENMVGCLIIKNIDWSVPKCELAYFIDEQFEGKGIISNALAWGIYYSFRKLKVEKLYLRISPHNEGSKRVAIKNGFIKEGLLRKDYRNGKGEIIDVEYFGLTP